jgi:fructose-1,6-bisphosphatase I / sedoheptulose-1,7-bisphosphatase
LKKEREAMPRANLQPMLTQFLIDERRRFPQASGDFNGLILDVATACKTIARAVANGSLDGLHGNHEGASLNVHGETQKKLDVYGNACFLRFNEASGTLAGLVSEEMTAPYQIPEGCPRGKYLLLFDPLDGSSNIDVNAPVGTVFSVLRAPDPGREVTEADFLQPGSRQVAAGYALYGPATMLVLTVGNGVHGFTLDPHLGDFVLTHPNLRIPADSSEFSINSSNSRFWETPVKRYVDECLKGTTGPRGKDFNMRWIASMVADAHRLLLRGGVFLYPRDNKTPGSAGRLRLLYEANPLGFLVEQAGGRASTGREPVLGVQPTSIHQRIGLVFGSKNEVERIERYHAEPDALLSGEPLFAQRGLFRD